MQCCCSSVFSERVLIDFLRNEAAAVAAFVVVDVIDQTSASLEGSMASWALDLLRLGMVLSVSASGSDRLKPRP